ncbi:hypothetical protein HK405_006037 [Cladochytrium tenue]|nr:hypothetical protein HK405_006037 [Cladochytrium tenue]
MLASSALDESEEKLNAGLDLMRQALAIRTQRMRNEIGQWRQTASNQRHQIYALESEKQTLQGRISELERLTSAQETEIIALKASKAAIQDKYNVLKRNASQLESFRKNIVSMVEHGPSGSLMEQFGKTNSILESELSTGGFSPQIGSATHDILSKLNTSISYSRSQHADSSMIHNAHNSSVEYNNNGNKTGPLSAGTPGSPGRRSTAATTTSSHDRNQREDWRSLSPPIMLEDIGTETFRPKAGVANSSPNLATAAADPLANPIFAGTGGTAGRSSIDGRPPMMSSENKREVGRAHELDQRAKSSHAARTPASGVAPAAAGSPGTAVDAASLYRSIRERLTAGEFEAFAANVAAFNASAQTAEETLRNVAAIVGEPVLVAQMRRLIYSALGQASSAAAAAPAGSAGTASSAERPLGEEVRVV